jgi:hypothetical protein
MGADEQRGMGEGVPCFRFEASWLEEENCEIIVENAWKLSMNVRAGSVSGAIGDVAADLWGWSKNILGDLEKRIKDVKQKLEACRRKGITRAVVNKEEVLKYKLEKLETQKETYWRQRAKAHCLQHGDKNTKFFHQHATERRRVNRIKKLVKDDGSVVQEKGEIHNLVTDFYKTLFQSRAGLRYDELLQHIPSRVTGEMNDSLMKEYTDEEIKKALDDMGDLKAPGAGGMPALFYKKFWGIIGADVIREVRKLLSGGSMPESWNETIVVLIPKVTDPEHLKDLRPISLYNVVYKTASKVVSNRLKLVLPEIVSLNQSAFVPGRLITGNVLLAYEFTHYMQNKRKGLDEYAALKLDMSKAYDRVEWTFLEKCWVSWVSIRIGWMWSCNW